MLVWGASTPGGEQWGSVPIWHCVLTAEFSIPWKFNFKMWLNHSRLQECPGIYASPFIMLHPRLTILQLQKSRREAFTPQKKLSERRYLESIGFGAHTLDKFILFSTLYCIQSVDVLSWSNWIICPVAQDTQAISHVRFHKYKKVPELSRDRSSNNRGLWNLVFPTLYPLPAPTHKPSQEAQTPRGWGNNIAPGYPPSSSSYAWKSWSNTSNQVPEAMLLVVANRAEGRKQTS